jgi:uncharacterized protein (TIGR04255 family)
MALDDSRRLVERVSAVEPTSSEPQGATILDIDCIWEGEVGSQRTEIEPILESLHDDIWREFDSALTDRLLLRLTGGSNHGQKKKKG